MGEPREIGRRALGNLACFLFERRGIFPEEKSCGGSPLLFGGESNAAAFPAVTGILKEVGRLCFFLRMLYCVVADREGFEIERFN